jgi:sarcosine oxidase
LFAERCVVQHTKQAQKHGASIHTNERMVKYAHNKDGTITVTTNKGVYMTKQLIISAGSWSNKFIHVKHKPYVMGVPERQVVAWFEPKDAKKFQIDTFPIFIITSRVLHTSEKTHTHLYGFPAIEGGQLNYKGFKIGIYGHFNEIVDPDVRENTKPNAIDEQELKRYTEAFFPEAAGKTVMLKDCMFTNTVDGHFVIDTLPDGHGNVTVAGGFSGHGFKFASVVGEILADMATRGGKTSHNIELFRINRQ